MLARVKDRYIKQVPDDESAKRLAEEMQSAGRLSLRIDVEKSQGKSLRFLKHFPFLQYLAVGGPARDLDAISGLTQLRELCLMSVSVPDFGFLGGLPDLRILDMRLGGSKSYESLAAARRLVGLSLLRVHALTNLNFLASLPELQFLKLHACKGIACLPDLSANPKLRKIVLDVMNGLETLAGIETAPGLELLVVSEAAALPPPEFQRVTQCPSLRKVHANAAIPPSRRHTESVSHVPHELLLPDYYGTEYAEFIFDGYQQPA
jgi:hypothetical protein